MLGVSIVFPIKCFEIVRRRDKRKIWEALWIDFEEKSPNKYFGVFELIKRTFSPLALVMCYHIPVYQIGFLIMINLIFLICLILQKPKKTRRINSFSIVQETLVFAVHISFVLFLNNDPASYEDYGDFVLSLISISVLFGLLPVLLDQLGFLKSIFKTLFFRKKISLQRKRTVKRKFRSQK